MLGDLHMQHRECLDCPALLCQCVIIGQCVGASTPLQLADTALTTCKQISHSLQGDSLVNMHHN